MDDLPIELLTHICSFACTDGGATARALSLACWQLHQAVRPVRFFSVALVPNHNSLAENAAQVLASIEAERVLVGSPDAGAKVRHLFITTVSRQRQPTGHDTAGPVFTLLRAVARDLISLAVIGFPYDGLESFNNVIFPALRELTTYGLMTNRYLLGGRRDADGCALYPALERFHGYDEVLSHFEDMDKDAPRLTHLRFSEVSSLDWHWFSCGTRSLMYRTLPMRGFTAGDAPAVFPYVRYVAIQPIPPPDQEDPSWRSELSHHFQYVRGMWNLLSWADPTGPLISILPPDESLGVESASERRVRLAKEDWLSRLQGGDGCWAGMREYSRGARERDLPEYLFPPELLAHLR
ncbi:hypothetical protein C8Q79DRAFT_540312 [Trametes meyenii]|nr:hypothetical protein C8Q79DRAFT_540312 [Trametes meyenii]